MKLSVYRGLLKIIRRGTVVKDKQNNFNSFGFDPHGFTRDVNW